MRLLLLLFFFVPHFEEKGVGNSLPLALYYFLVSLANVGMILKHKLRRNLFIINFFILTCSWCFYVFITIIANDLVSHFNVVIEIFRPLVLFLGILTGYFLAKDNKKTMIKVIAVVALANVCVQILQILDYDFLSPYWHSENLGQGRYAGLFLNPNVGAIVLSYLLVTALSLSRSRKVHALCFLLLVSILLEGSRAAFLALSIALAVIYFRLKYTGAILLAFIALALLYVYNVGNFRVYLLLDYIIHGDTSGVKSMFLRFQLWAFLLRSFFDFTVFDQFVGIGPDKTAKSLSYYMDSDYLNVLIRYGLGGVFLYLHTLFLIIYYYIRTGLNRYMGAVIALMVVYGIAAESLMHWRVSFIFGIVMSFLYFKKKHEFQNVYNCRAHLQQEATRPLAS